VIDPQHVTTNLSHDPAGRRTRITRHGRTWTYTYEKNGNVIAEQSPGSPNPPLTDPDYTTTIVYDDLDRVTSKVIGQRSLSPADQALFGGQRETFTWDSGPNHIGHLRFWTSYAPGSSFPALKLKFSRNRQGQPTSTIHTLTIPGYPTLDREVRQNYFLFGGVRQTFYGDRVGGSNKSRSEMTYDARGLPAQMRLFRRGEPSLTLAVQTRNVAGLVTKRRINTTGLMPFVESNWTYDTLGRVASQVVQKGPRPTQVVRQDLAYFGNDDPSSLTHYLGTTGRQFTYGYDLRHQLTSVTSTTEDYFTAHYTYGSGGRLAQTEVSQRINPLPAGTEVKPRHVNYIYGGTDPEQVTALTNVVGGERFATYTYDATGNQSVRCYGVVTGPTCAGESMAYVYDGKDQLRRATRKLNNVVQGSEEYWYDGTGQRIAVVKRNATGAKTEMIWFIGDVQAHYNGAGAVTCVYSHLSMGTPVARVQRTANTTTTVEYQFHGLASNTIAAVAQDGTINASFSYAPFGEVIETTNAGGASAGTAAHKRRLNDKYEDDLTSLAYYGARYYDKMLIGWTQADPLYVRLPDLAHLSSPRRANVYGFSLNNSLRYLDPDGLDATGNTKTTGKEKDEGIPELMADFFNERRGFHLAPDKYDPYSYIGGETRSESVASTPCVVDMPSPIFKGGLNDPIEVTAREKACLKDRKSCPPPTLTQAAVVAGLLVGTAILGTLAAVLLPESAVVGSQVIPGAAAANAGAATAMRAAPLIGTAATLTRLPPVAERLPRIVDGIREGYKNIQSASQALDLVRRSATSLNLALGGKKPTDVGGFIIQHVGNVVTTIAPNGGITITKGTQVILELKP
jgi:RHS repeat-associated protein